MVFANGGVGRGMGWARGRTRCGMGASPMDMVFAGGFDWCNAAIVEQWGYLDSNTDVVLDRRIGHMTPFGCCGSSPTKCSGWTGKSSLSIIIIIIIMGERLRPPLQTAT